MLFTVTSQFNSSYAGFLLNLGVFIRLEEPFKSCSRNTMELDPLHELELFLDHLISGVGQPIPLVLTFFEAGEETLETQLEASEEADRNPLILHVLVLDLDGDLTIFRFYVLVLSDEEGVVT